MSTIPVPLSGRIPVSVLAQVLFAGLATGAAVGVNLLLIEIADIVTFPIFLAAIVFCAWYAGTLSGVLCLLMCMPFIPLLSAPRWEPDLGNRDDWIRTAVFAATAIAIIVLDAVRRRAEKKEAASLNAYREQDERLRIAMSAGRMGAWEWDIRDQRVKWNAEVDAMRGVESDGFEGTIVDFLGLVHPDDREPLQMELSRSLGAGAPDVSIEARILHEDGSTHWVAAKGQVSHDAKGQPLTVVGVVWDDTERKLNEERLKVVAAENERLLEETVQAVERQRFLLDAGAVLAASLEHNETLDAVVRLAVPALADLCAIHVKQPDGRMERVALSEQDPKKRRIADEMSSRYPPEKVEHHPIMLALSTGKTQHVEDIGEELLESISQGDEHSGMARQILARSGVFIPLYVHGTAFGVLTLTMSHETEREFTPTMILTAEGLAQRAAIAIENARLYRDTREARERQQFLVVAGTLLSASLDYEETVRRVTELPIPELADAAALYALRDGTLELEAWHYAYPEKVDVFGEAVQAYLPTGQPNHPASVAIQTNTTNFLPEVTIELVRELAASDAAYEAAMSVRPLSSIVVPLIVHGQPLGALLMVTTVDSGRTLGSYDVLIAEGFAQRAALALQNASLYAESQRTQEELRRANEAKDEFLGMVSHELRTPVTTMYSGARYLLSRFDQTDEETKKEILGDVEHESQRLQLIIENLLALARQELGQGAQSEPVSVNRTVQQAIRRVGKLNPRRAIEFEEGGNAFAETVPIYLDLVLRNVLDNADKYSPSDRPIQIATGSENGTVQISVRDFGPGISDEEHEKIFDRFYRSQSVPSTTSGAGIGLSVCRRLMESQGGAIETRNAEGGGLEVTMTLPAHKQDD